MTQQKQQTVRDWITERSRQRLREIFARVKHFGLAIVDDNGQPMLAPVDAFVIAEVAKLQARCDLLEQAMNAQHQERANDGSDFVKAVRH